MKIKVETRDANKKIGRKVKSKSVDERGECTSGISEMDAIAEMVVLELESSNPRRGLWLCRWRQNCLFLGEG